MKSRFQVDGLEISKEPQKRDQRSWPKMPSLDAKVRSDSYRPLKASNLLSNSKALLLSILKSFIQLMCNNFQEASIVVDRGISKIQRSKLAKNGLDSHMTRVELRYIFIKK